LQDWLSIRNIKAASFALLLFIYPILVLSTASIRYTETIHRVTVGQTFDETLFGSTMADSLAALGFSLLFVGLSFQLTRVRIAIIATFAAAVALYLAGLDVLLQAAGIAALPVVTTLIVAFTLAGRKHERKINEPSFYHTARFQIDGTRVAGALLVIIIVLEIGAAARWIVHPFFPTEIYGDPSWSFAKLESALFQSLGLLSPALVVLIGFSFFYKWFLRDVLKKFSHSPEGHDTNNSDEAAASIATEKVRTPLNENNAASAQHKDFKNTKISREISGDSQPVISTFAPKTASTLTTNKKVHLLFLSAALVIAPLLVLYPHHPGINPSGSGVSTDEQYYMNWLIKLRANPDATWTDTIAKAFSINKGDRPLTLLLILTIANITGETDLIIVRYLPVALAPSLVLANYILIRYSLKSKDDNGRVKLFAAIGGLFAVFSPQIVTGEYAGLLANGLGLVAAYFAFYLVIRGWESKDRKQLAVSLGILFAILLVTMLLHLYMWANLLAAILVFAAISYAFARKTVVMPKAKILFIMSMVVMSLSIDYARASVLSTPAVTDSNSTLATNIESYDTSGRWERLYFTLYTYMGGFLSNPALLILAFVWLIRADISKGLDRLVLSTFFILAVPIAVGSIEFQTRVLYNIPFQVPALLALHTLNSKHRTNNTLLIIAVIATLATFALRAMANLYLEVPEGYELSRQFLLP
jgi:hypothetical protein